MGDETNAKDEFIRVTDGFKVVCAKVGADGYSFDDKREWIFLMPNYTQVDFEAFLKKLDFKYDSGYGGQELFGVICCEDGIWFDRGEYDGSEWWAKHSYPDIGEEFYNL